MLFNGDSDKFEFQGYYLDENDIEPLLKQHCIYKEKEELELEE